MHTTSLCEMNIHKSLVIACGCIKLSIDMITIGFFYQQLEHLNGEVF